MSSFPDQDLHAGQPVLASGAPLDEASAAMLLVHGRGASAVDILSLADELDVPGFAYLAPQAAGSVWYPHPFLAPLEANQPWLDSALAALDRSLQAFADAGIPRERTVLLGFSQGASLSLEYAARHGVRRAVGSSTGGSAPLGGVVGLSGGLIGPEIEIKRYAASLEGLQVFLGCSDVDPYIPRTRVVESAATFEKLGALVTLRLYPGMPHTVNDDELEAVRSLMKGILLR